MNTIGLVLRIIEQQVASLEIPWVTQESSKGDPFRVLVSCILSLRTKEAVTIQASISLLGKVKTPKELLTLSQKEIENLIYPVGFYRNKAKVLLNIASSLILEYNSCVPDTLEELLTLKGVGLKTANLVLGLGFKIPAICVDTHVHRIANRLGWIETENPDDSEVALRHIVLEKYWIKLNTILVMFGQNICVPVSPWCSKCGVVKYCSKVGVKKNR